MLVARSWTSSGRSRSISSAISLSIVVLTSGLHLGPVTLGAGSLWLPIVIIGLDLHPVRGPPGPRPGAVRCASREFVHAAIGQGASDRRLMRREILPNVITTVIVFFPLMIATTMLTEAALSFLSVGVQPPDASWGTIINDGQALLYTRPVVAIAPGRRDRADRARRSTSSATAARRARPARQAARWRSRRCSPSSSAGCVSMLFVLFAISVLVFLIFFATPGVDPAARIAGRNADPATLAAGAPRLRPRPPAARSSTRMMMKQLFITPRPDVVRQPRQPGHPADHPGRARDPLAGVRRGRDLGGGGDRHGRLAAAVSAARSSTRC